MRDKPKMVWVATFSARMSRLEGERTLAIVMNTNSFESATDINFFITNIESSKVTSQWVVSS